ncbi:MAG: hypothetical protein KOO60_02295 [Gemmatimonadales bacterium]|nr:hypothetical protein [Gemmatimonadales bacterium]
MKIRALLSLLSFAVILAFGGCSDDSTTDPIVTSPETLDIAIFEASKDIAPSFADSETKAAWDLNGHMFGLYHKLRAYDDAIHQGVIGMDNFFKSLHTMEEDLFEAMQYAEAIDPTVIEEPYEFGNSDTYEFAANVDFAEEDGTTDQYSFAYRLDGDAIHFLVIYRQEQSEPENKVEICQFQGILNPESGDLELKIVSFVDYVDDEYYCSVLNEISGNTETHEFQLRMATSGSGGLDATIVGKGISSGEESYFLIKMDIVDDMGTDLGDRYFVFPSGADEAFIRAMDTDGLAYADLPDSVNDFAEDVQALEFYVEEDLPTSQSEFNGGNTILVF